MVITRITRIKLSFTLLSLLFIKQVHCFINLLGHIVPRTIPWWERVHQCSYCCPDSGTRISHRGWPYTEVRIKFTRSLFYFHLCGVTPVRLHPPKGKKVAERKNLGAWRTKRKGKKISHLLFFCLLSVFHRAFYTSHSAIPNRNLYEEERWRNVVNGMSRV